MITKASDSKHRKHKLELKNGEKLPTIILKRQPKFVQDCVTTICTLFYYESVSNENEEGWVLSDTIEWALQLLFSRQWTGITKHKQSKY